MPGGHRQFEEDDVDEFLRQQLGQRVDPPKIHRPADPELEVGSCTDAPMGPRVRGPEPPPTSLWGDQVEAARSEARILKAQQEGQAIRRAMREDADQSAQRAEQERLRRETEQRIQELKSFGRNLALDLPPNARARVIALLEDFVTPRQFPTSVNNFEAWAIIQDQVDRVRASEREAHARAEEVREQEKKREWAALQQSIEESRQQEQLEKLIEGGKRVALVNTLGWVIEDAELARRDIERELRDEVQPDWTEADVRKLVLDALQEWGEDDADEEDDDDRIWDDEDEA